MVTDNAVVEEQQSETSFSETGPSSQNQVAIPVSNNSVVRVSESSSSDEWSTTSDEDDGKQVAEITPQASANNGFKIVNTYTDCTGVNSTVHNTTIYKDGVTVNNNFYCCPFSLNYVLKLFTTRRRIIIFIASVLGILLIIFLSIWLSNLKTPKSQNDVETETTLIIVTTEKMPQTTTASTTIIPPISTDSTTTTTMSTSTDPSNGSTTESPNTDWKIIKRTGWGAAPPTSPPVILPYLPPIYVIFSETETETCKTAQKCTETVRHIQAAQMKDGLEDIAYNFLIGGDGIVYEGRGWDVHASGKDYDTDYFDDLSISVSFIGKFDAELPTEIILQAARTFLEFGAQNNKLVPSPKLKCLRQLSHTIKNPGDNLYKIIESWKGWDNRTIEAFPPIPY